MSPSQEIHSGNGSARRRGMGLQESAEKSLSQMLELKSYAAKSRRHHFTRETREIIDTVTKRLETNNVSLKEWKASVASGEQTDDVQVIRNVKKYFEQLESQIQKARKDLDKRLSVFLPSQK